MSDKLVTKLSSSSGVDMSNDMLVINDASDPTELKRMTPATLTAAFATWAQTLTNKILTSPVINTGVSEMPLTLILLLAILIRSCLRRRQ